MKIHFLRKDTYIIIAKNERYLVNPYFGESNTPLPLPIKDVLKNITAVIITIMSDEILGKQNLQHIAKNFTFYTSKEQITDKLKSLGYKNVRQISEQFQKYTDLYANLNYKPTNGEVIYFD
ncbi:MAG: hypothetical protein MJ237_03775 [bacterium]|nr:hypothetical protein [bacterium]